MISFLNKKYQIVPKLAYFNTAILYYSLHQFKSSLIKEMFDVDPKSIGVLFSVPQVASFISILFTGYLNDKTGKQRHLMAMGVLLSSLFFSLIFTSKSVTMFLIFFTLFVSSISPISPILDKVILDHLNQQYFISNKDKSNITNYSKDNSNSKVKVRTNDNNNKDSIKMDDTINNNKGKDSIKMNDTINNNKDKDSIKMDDTINNNSNTDSIKMNDTINNNSNTDSIKMDSFGNIKLWWSMGYIFTTFAIEHLITADYNKIILFYIINVPVVLTLYYIFIKDTQILQMSNVFHSLGELIKIKEYILINFIILLSGISRAFMTTYLSLYFTDISNIDDEKYKMKTNVFFDSFINFLYDHKQATTILCSFISEVVIFTYEKSIISRVGLFWTLLLSQVFQGMRFTLFYFLYNLKHSFPVFCGVELFKGASYSLETISIVHLASRLAPDHLQTTAQVFCKCTNLPVATIFSGILFEMIFQEDSSLTEYRNAFLVNILLCNVSIAVIVLRYWRYLINPTSTHPKFSYK